MNACQMLKSKIAIEKKTFLAKETEFPARHRIFARWHAIKEDNFLILPVLTITSFIGGVEQMIRSKRVVSRFPFVIQSQVVEVC